MGNKIVIEITDANTPPKVTLNGEKIEIKEIVYCYDTATPYDFGQHELLLTYANKGKKQLDKLGFEK